MNWSSRHTKTSGMSKTLPYLHSAKECLTQEYCSIKPVLSFVFFPFKASKKKKGVVYIILNISILKKGFLKDNTPMKNLMLELTSLELICYRNHPRYTTQRFKKPRQMHCRRLGLWKVLKFPTVKLKNLSNETSLEMRKDTQKDNADFIKKKE